MPMSASRIGAAAMTLSLVACSATQPTPVTPTPPPHTEPALTASAVAAVPPPTASAAPIAAPRRASLRFDLQGDDFPSPLVDVVVSGTPTTMIVDTGATHPVVASWIAAQIGSAKATNVSGLDHTGKAIALSKLDGATLIVSGWGPVDSASMFVIQVPPALQKRG